MSNLFLCLVAVLCVVSSFYGGIVVGIADCKKRFGIPKKAVGALDGEYIYN